MNHISTKCNQVLNEFIIYIRHFANCIRSHPNITKSTKAGLSAGAQLLVALRYYATGNSLDNNAIGGFVKSLNPEDDATLTEIGH